MQVYKFGGASIATPQRMQALQEIVGSATKPLLVVISALGKTTNALEQIANNAYNGHHEKATELASKLKKEHLAYASALFQGDTFTTVENVLMKHFAELENALGALPVPSYDCLYDSIVCMGEILSSCLFSHFLQHSGIPNHYIDARQVIITDDTYRDAAIDWDKTNLNAHTIIAPYLQANGVVVTQGFIGSTTQGKPVTLGREGSDYSAAVLAAMLNMRSATIWKDVEGFRNADPKQFPDTVKIDAISYTEVIEMAFYGAQIIHPKTIKPLQNNNIPLYVKCFLDKNLVGTEIKDIVATEQYPPLIVLKENQVLLQVTTRDFSFITEDNLSKLYAIFHELKIRVNVIQNAAISFVTCIDNQEDKISKLIDRLGKDYKVLTNNQVSLLTIRHYNADILSTLTQNKQIYLKQETRKTVQVVMK